MRDLLSEDKKLSAVVEASKISSGGTVKADSAEENL
jgi:hypothetical protein